MTVNFGWLLVAAGFTTCLRHDKRPVPPGTSLISSQPAHARLSCSSATHSDRQTAMTAQLSLAFLPGVADTPNWRNSAYAGANTYLIAFRLSTILGGREVTPVFLFICLSPLAWMQSDTPRHIFFSGLFSSGRQTWPPSSTYWCSHLHFFGSTCCAEMQSHPAPLNYGTLTVFGCAFSYARIVNSVCFSPPPWLALLEFAGEPWNSDWARRMIPRLASMTSCFVLGVERTMQTEEIGSAQIAVAWIPTDGWKHLF
jgi:hypothetical protein